MKTRKEEFFEKYPNAPRNDKGYPDGCIISLYPNKHCTAKSCEICWGEISENADMVEVIRCKDCIHIHDNDCPFVLSGFARGLDDFCSWAESND